MSTTEAQNKTHIDSTIETIEEHVKKESLTGIPTSIGSWIKTLNEHKELTGIAGNLEKLKEAIAAKDGKKIVTLMTTLGEETTKAAENAEGNQAKSIHQLGKVLSTAAKAISKFA